MKRTLTTLVILLFCTVCVSAEEGMWLLDQIKGLNLDKQGLQISVDEIYQPGKPNLVDAVVNLGGGTAEFVSPDGLLLTNHHVAFGAVQRASVEGTDYVTDGFVAMDRGDEIQAPGYSANVLQSMEDVTAEVLAAGQGLTDPVERRKSLDAKMQAMREEIEEGKEHIAARVASMYNGKQYLLFVHQRFDDVRVVYVPPASIGNYGGDVDNWMWPRHTGDFSFLRVYMGPDGAGRKYHQDNVPFQPKKWLKVATQPLKEGDFTFILGYPGRTTRFRTSNSVAYNLAHTYPDTVSNYGEIIDLLKEISDKHPDAAIKVAAMDKGLNNTMKNLQGKMDGMTKTNFLEKKTAFEKEFQAFLNSNPEQKDKFGDVLPAIRKQYDILETDRIRDTALQNFGFSGSLSSIATQIYWTVREREKPDSERSPNFSERDVERRVARLHFAYLSYSEPADKALLRRALQKAGDLPESSRIRGLEKVLEAGVDRFVERAYVESKLSDVEFAKSLFSNSSKELDAVGDPFLDMAKDLYEEQEAMRKRTEKFAANILDLRKRYIDALYAWKGEGLYPDANSTIRLTYGQVAGYSPRDAVTYAPFTTLAGAIEKDTGVKPFNAPDELKTLAEKKDFGRWADGELGDVPVAFTHRCDITGGNSGSPVLNATGELVGIAFDGNYEAMTSDWQYDYDMQRAISVDIRYVMFITEKLSKAEHVLEEMGLRETR